MATIKPIERKSVHQIQSGQVIGDGLTSVVKELVENSFDANATSIEVRFKNYGLDSIEVVDNGIGITSDNYESVALKHWTSKLTSYDDLDTVTTFGFRGEALSSLCALSDLQITTATANEAPKGTRLEFGASGKLKSRSVVAAQRGTTVLVENIFKTLPVRRKELERNIKREYTKVLGILQAYAGICVGVKFSVFNQPSKGRKTPVFATKGNPTTRENIANVFGAKTLTALVALDLQFEMKSTRKGVGMTRIAGGSESKEVKIVGHISRPIVGEGRQAPDRQMFFVNGRPCILPQISKAFNEVYKSFNVTQSPFIFADILMDTNAYDVNVSPDKRSILLHDQIELLESLKTSLIEMFTNHEQTVPHAQLGAKAKIPTYKQLTLNRPAPSRAPVSSSSPAKEPRNDGQKTGNCAEFLDNTLKATEPSDEEPNPHTPSESLKPHNKDKVPLIYKVGSPSKLHEMKFKPTIQGREKTPELVKKLFSSTTTADEVSSDLLAGAAEEFERDEPELPPTFSSPTHPSESYTLTAMTSPFSKLSYHSPRRPQASKATIKIGDREPVTAGSSPPASPSKRRKIISPVRRGSEIVKLGKLGQPRFSSGALNRFAASGVQVQLNDEAEDETEDDGDEAKEEDDGGGNKRQEECGQDIMILDDEEGGTGRQGGSVQDIMVLDVDEYTDEDLEEIFKDASQLGEITAYGEVGDQNDAKEEAERGDLGQASSKLLFLPSEGLYEYSGGEAADEGAGKRAEDEEPGPINNTEDEDLVNESEHLKQSSIRAQKLLEEAEEAAAKPTSKNLERAFEILEGSRAHSTKNISRTYSTSMTSLRQQSKSILKFSASVDTGGVPLSSSALNEDDVSAEERLNLTITKKDFFEMQVKGQFNKGFILATRGEDLFIIDQHASDEKYNFETLQQETVVQNQRLVVPKTLELMAMDEVIVTEHLGVFKKNGFIIEVDPEAPTGARCRLISLPLSKETVFGIKDLEELIHLVHENQGNSSVRCSKIRSMFAMRACKKSTKVGRALTAKGMEKIVRHMGELDKPWNCPHGRPTMRHLTDLGQVVCWSEYDSGQGGLGGLQWGGQNWADTWCAMLDSSDNEGGG